MGNDQIRSRTPVSSVETGRLSHYSTWKIAAVMAVSMALLAIVGTVVAFADLKWAEKYWLMLVPVYGFMCVFTAWHREGLSGRLVTLQLLHWLTVVVAIAIGYAYLNHMGQETAAATGLNTLLILGVGCLMAGIHLEWIFGLVGGLLFALVILIAYAREYLGIILLAAAVVAVAAFFAHRFWKKRSALKTGKV